MRKINIPLEDQVHNTGSSTQQIPMEIGNGSVSMLELKTGIKMYLSDFRLNSATQMEYESYPSVFGFGFCLSGDINNNTEGIKDTYNIKSGQSALFHFNGNKMEETISENRVIRLNIMLEPDSLQNFLGKNLEESLPLLKKLKSSPFRISDTLTPAMRTAFMQILECPYQGIARDFFLESKAVELIAYKIHQIEEMENPKKPRNFIKSEDIDKTMYAAELMLKDLENPPNLDDLALKIGMCKSKLHKCFREVYQITPFEFLRQKRLETAERLLKAGEVNVSQAAYSVGYSSLSHFTKAFKQHLGYLPGKFNKKLSNN